MPVCKWHAMHRSRKTANPKSSEGELGALISDEAQSKIETEMIGKSRIDRIDRYSIGRRSAICRTSIDL